jgi:hypothetical protein
MFALTPHPGSLPHFEPRVGPEHGRRRVVLTGAAGLGHWGVLKTNPSEPIEVNSCRFNKMHQILMKRTHWSYLAPLQVLTAKKGPILAKRGPSRTRIRGQEPLTCRAQSLGPLPGRAGKGSRTASRRFIEPGPEKKAGMLLKMKDLASAYGTDPDSRAGHELSGAQGLRRYFAQSRRPPSQAYSLSSLIPNLYPRGFGSTGELRQVTQQ